MTCFLLYSTILTVTITDCGIITLSTVVCCGLLTYTETSTFYCSVCGLLTYTETSTFYCSVLWSVDLHRNL